MKVKVMICWLLVALPLGWGVTQSVKKALPLFSPGAPSADTPKAGSVR
jgi:hypothetical protein